MSLSTVEWHEITAPLKVPLLTASNERAAIAMTVGNMENVVGQRTGTHLDRGGNFTGFGQPGQMDCIDESTNTTTYMNMMAENNLLQHHSVMDRSTSFGFFAGAPHTTAVIGENSSGQRFAVDSWFYDNGQPPAILDIQTWKAGWDPDEAVNE